MNFYEYLRQGLEDKGFTKSDYDDCLFTNDTIMVLFWVDSYTFYTKEKHIINKVIVSLKDGFLLEQEEDVAGFLGIRIQRNIQEGTATMTHICLIDIVLEVMGLEESSMKFAPADKMH